MEQKARWKLAGDGLSTMYWANVAALVGVVIMVPPAICLVLGIELKGVEWLLSMFGVVLGAGGGLMNLTALLGMRQVNEMYMWAWKVFLIGIGVYVVQNEWIKSIRPLSSVIAVIHFLLIVRGTNLLLEEAEEAEPVLLRLAWWAVCLTAVHEVLLMLPAGTFGLYQTHWRIGLDTFSVICSILKLIYFRDAGRSLLGAAGA